MPPLCLLGVVLEDCGYPDSRGRKGRAQNTQRRVSPEEGGEATLDQPCQVSTERNICEGAVAKSKWL